MGQSVTEQALLQNVNLTNLSRREVATIVACYALYLLATAMGGWAWYTDWTFRRQPVAPDKMVEPAVATASRESEYFLDSKVATKYTSCPGVVSQQICES